MLVDIFHNSTCSGDDFWVASQRDCHRPVRLILFKSYTVVLNIQAVGKNLTRHSAAVEASSYPPQFLRQTVIKSTMGLGSYTGISHFVSSLFFYCRRRERAKNMWRFFFAAIRGNSYFLHWFKEKSPNKNTIKWQLFRNFFLKVVYK